MGEPMDLEGISRYWSDQLNNEIYLKDRPDVVRGSPEYFDIILAARAKYMYYFDRIIDHFGNIGGGRALLEVGCGMGTDLIRFARLGYSVHGIDLAEGHVALAKACFKVFGQDAAICLGNAEALDFPANTFDAVYSFGVLHHTPDTTQAIAEVYRTMKPGGRGFLMLYHRHSLNNFIHWLLRYPFENPKDRRPGARDAPVTSRFTRGEVRAMCSAFKTVRIETEYAYGAGYGRLYDWTPKPLYRALSKLLGWHLLVFLEK